MNHGVGCRHCRRRGSVHRVRLAEWTRGHIPGMDQDQARLTDRVAVAWSTGVRVEEGEDIGHAQGLAKYSLPTSSLLPAVVEYSVMEYSVCSCRYRLFSWRRVTG